MEILKDIYDVGITPVVSVDEPDRAVALAKAMLRGGLPVLEITFRTPNAHKALYAIRRACPEMIVGAGTVLNRAQADMARDAGACFTVSPGFDETLTQYCRDRGQTIIPGVSCASEIQRAVNMGLKVLKLFPAEPLGGLKTIDYLAAPFPNVLFLPAGGCDFSNLAEFFHNPHVFACAGGFVARPTHIQAEDWEMVTMLCRRARLTALDFRITRLCLPCKSRDEADGNTKFLCAVLGLPSGTSEEGFVPEFTDGEGYLEISTSSIERAAAYLQEQGFSVQAAGEARKMGGAAAVLCILDRIYGMRVELRRAGEEK